MHVLVPNFIRNYIEKRWQRTGALTEKKLREYVPIMLVNNLSVLLLLTVDGLVLGNLVGANALAAVNIFQPATLLIGVASNLVASGAGTCIAVAVGKGDYDALRRLKSAIKRTMVTAAIIMSVVQVPLVAGIIASYGLDEHMTNLTWQYALGIMISTPFGLISTVGTFQLQATGNMRWLMRLSIMEGLANLALDLLFVGPLGMGPMGASLGTACSNVLRCTATIIILARKTDAYKTGGVKADAAAYKDLLSSGIPDAVNALMLALQNYFIMKIVIMAFGDSGGVIKGVCSFCFSLANVAIGGTRGAMIPLMGIFTGARDWNGLRTLVKQSVGLLVGIVGILSVIIFIFPEAFYVLHGVNELPPAGQLSLRIFALHFVFRGCNTLFRLYFVNRKDTRFATSLTVVGNAALPLFAFLLSKVAPPAFIWLADLLTETVIIALNLWHYRRWVQRDRDEVDKLVGALSLSVSPHDAADASREIKRLADELGAAEHVAYRVSLCVEEMVAYAVEANAGEGLSIQVGARFMDDSATLTILDDGKCIALDENRDHQELVIDNYNLVKRTADEVSYQYVLNMNFTILHFREQG